MQEIHKHWIEQIKSLCASADVGHIDVVVDQAGWELSVLPALRSIQTMPWFSLFSGTPEESLLEQAPILMRFSLDKWRHDAWLEELVKHLWGLPRLIVLISPMPFDALAATLQASSQLEWVGQTGLLRFYDPRVLPQLLSNVLTAEQKERFLSVALLWSWLDRDQQPTWQSGTYRSNQVVVEPPHPISLTDAQFDRLGSIGDAQTLLGIAKAYFPSTSYEQCFTRCYRLVLQASEESYFGDMHAYARLNFEKNQKQTGMAQ
jgi:hypothetical protein